MRIFWKLPHALPAASSRPFESHVMHLPRGACTVPRLRGVDGKSGQATVCAHAVAQQPRTVPTDLGPRPKHRHAPVRADLLTCAQILYKMGFAAGPGWTTQCLSLRMSTPCDIKAPTICGTPQRHSPKVRQGTDFLG